MQDVEAFGVRSHQPVLDPVVNHLHEVPGTMVTAVKISARRRRRAITARRKRRQHRLDPCEVRLLATCHQAVAALEPEHPTARAHIHIVNARRLQLAGTPNVIVIMRVATVDDDVARLQQRLEVGDHRLDHRRRHHQPDDPRRIQQLHELGKRRAAARAGLSISFAVSGLRSNATH